jgi:starvation-inducible outer membrane lipoprotein
MRRSVKVMLVAVATQTMLSACATAPPPQNITAARREECRMFAKHVVKEGEKYVVISAVLAGPIQAIASTTDESKERDRRIMYNKCLAHPGTGLTPEAAKKARAM